MRPPAFINIGSRRFIVQFDENDQPIYIKERKKCEKPLVGWYDQPYWSAKHHPLGKEWTLPRRILKAATEGVEKCG